VAGATRADLVARNTRLLVGAQVMLWGSAGSFAAFGPISVFDLRHRESLVGVMLALYHLGVATGAVMMGRVMDRAGRRPGLAASYALLATGGLAASVSVAAGSVPGLLAVGAVFGVGAAGALLGRTAVADMYPAERRGRAVGNLVVVGTIGAIGGPPLAGGFHALARRLDLFEPLAGPWLLIPLLCLVGLVFVLRLRPDPRDLAVDDAGPSEVGRRPVEILRLRPGTVAVVSIGVAQAVMVTFMSIIPVVVHSHGAAELTVSLIVSGHLAGMFAFSQVVGMALDRWGRRVGLLAGAVTSATGVLLGGFAGGTFLPGVGLFLIGVGWCAAYLGSTAVISDLSGPAERGRALGLADLVAALSAATGVLGGAFLLGATSIGVVAVAALILLTLPLLLLAPLQEAGPGQWPQAAPAVIRRSPTV
jgi:MFS family permease